MTPVPEDDLERALRRALSAAASRVEPGADGLERIRARTKKRPPQPWLLAVAGGAFSRARYWVWRGHWAWPDHLPRPSALPWLSSLPWPRLRRLPLPAGTLAARSQSTGPRLGERLRRIFSGPDGANWLRPVGVLAGVAFIAAIALGVPSLRSTIVQVSSTVLTGGQSSGSSGTDGNGNPIGTGTPTIGGKSSAATGTAATNTAGSPGSPATSGCSQPAGGSAQGGSGANPSATSAQVTGSSRPTVIPSVGPYPGYTSTPAAGCPTPSGSATTSPSATPSTTASPTPTGSSSPSVGPTGSSSPSVGPTGSSSPSVGPSTTPSDSPTAGQTAGANSTNPGSTAPSSAASSSAG
jgi:hypothetical protein